MNLEKRTNRALAFEEYIFQFLKVIKIDNEFIEQTRKFDFYVPNGILKLGIPKNSYIEIKYVNDEKNILNLLPYTIDMLRAYDNLFIIINVNANSKYLENFKNFKNRIITIDRLENEEINYVNSLSREPFNKIKKCIGINQLNDLVIYYARTKIIKTYLNQNIYIESNQIEATTKALFPFIYDNIEFYSSKRTINYEKNYLKRVRVSHIANKENLLEMIIDGKYYLVESKKENFVEALIDFLHSSIRSFNTSEDKYYKYKPLHDQNEADELNPFTKKIILSNELFFAPKSLLNDPFDLDIRDVVAKYNAKHDEYDVENYKVNPNPCLVLSLTSVNNNILMWSHYSDCHKGLCFQYKLNEIIDAVDKCPDVSYCVVGPVDYEYDRPRFTSLKSAGKLLPFDVCEEFFHIKSVFTKFKKWKYESEYRIVLFGNSDNVNEKGLVLNVPYRFVYYTESIVLNNKAFLIANCKTPTYELKRDDTMYLLK